NAQQKFNTMIASTELPDVMWMDRGPDVEKLRQADMLVPYDEYLDKYPNLKEWMGEEGLNMLRSPDGKLYQFPNWYTNQPNGNAGYVVNKQIYHELGSPKLETTDDLYEYLKAVKAKYVDKVVPFEPHVQGQGIEVLYSAFAENALTRWISIRGVPNGDKLSSIFTDPIFRESMQY
ncbi:extracellular solute-binding protein, partial [Clostridium perfringens]